MGTCRVQGALRMSDEINKKFGFMSAFGKKSSDRQRERIEKAREEKRANVQASSMEELIEKITEVDWDTVKSEKVPESGGRFDFSI